MNYVGTRALFLIVLLAAPAALHAQSRDVEERYERCYTLAMAENPNLEDAISACEVSAREGVPGAQHALGLLLFQKNEEQLTNDAIEWFEKAAANGHIEAAYVLASVYLQRPDEPSREKGAQLLRLSICSGYPPAESTLIEQRIRKEDVDCGLNPLFSFDGDWVGTLTWLKDLPGTKSDTDLELKVTFASGGAYVHVKEDASWSEVKPGSFKVSQLDETAIVSALDSSWDLDGKWIESWTIHLLRISESEATVSIVRTVNNPHLPASFGWRTFTTVAEGRMHRTPK